jgi:hypothetical protein
MANLQQDLLRASAIARLEKLTCALRAEGVAHRWERREREWFLSCLLPFSDQTSTESRLVPGSDAGTLDAGALFQEIVHQHSEPDRSALATELKGLAELYERLVAVEVLLRQEDVQRALRLAELAGRLLLSSVPSHPSAAAGAMAFARA